jgi:hypothetical protein
MKKYLLLSVVAAFAVTPALANEPTQPGLTSPGSNSADGDNVIQGAKDSAEGGKVVGETGDKTQPGLTSPGSNSADGNNVLDGAKESTEGRASAPAPAADDEKVQPGLTSPGSNSADGENRLPK